MFCSVQQQQLRYYYCYLSCEYRSITVEFKSALLPPPLSRWTLYNPAYLLTPVEEFFERKVAEDAFFIPCSTFHGRLEGYDFEKNILVRGLYCIVIIVVLALHFVVVVVVVIVTV